MPNVYFHWSDADHDLIDRRGAVVRNLAEACRHADHLVRIAMKSPDAADWRGWELRVTDEDGEEILVIPFATALGTLH